MKPHETNNGLHKTYIQVTNPLNSSSTSMDSSNTIQHDNDAVTVPLLLRPAYARAKSSVRDELRSFRISLKWCALDHSTTTSTIVSYATFVILTLIVPVVVPFSVHSSHMHYTVFFNRVAQLPESALAVLSFFTMSAFFRRYGLRQLLLLDGLRHDPVCVQTGYARELDRSFRYLAYILLPSFLVELAHKIVFFPSVSIRQASMLGISLPYICIVFFATLASWVYRTGVFLLVCVLFHLTCELQILRFEGLYKMFESESENTESIFIEHTRIKGQLKVTSHRYRIFMIACLVVITVSQLGALMLVLASKADKTFCNSGDMVVCSAVQVSGFMMCLIGAARITHRAQRVVSVATRWHLMFLLSKDRNHKKITHAVELEDELQNRQALVMYLQHNGSGITVYGFALDRGSLHTLFAFELTLVLWILSKVIVLS